MDLNLDYLSHLLSLNESELYNHIFQEIKPNFYLDDMYLYLHKDDNLPCLVAHIDTVHKQKPKLDDIVLENDILFNRGGYGLGADDRAGVYALLELKDLPYNLLFTNYEETGRKGVKRAIQDRKDVLSKNTCFIEIDRKGTGHYVDYIGAEQEFLDIFNKRELQKDDGTYSDITDLSSELSIASVNLACGYYKPHKDKEYLNIKELQVVIDLLKDPSLIQEVSKRQFRTR
jgi:Peptidase family M20/M25/M40.